MDAYLKYKEEALILPTPREYVVKAKREIRKEFDFSILTQEQKKAFNELAAFINRERGGMHLLEGVAGTGKTFLITMFIEWYLNYRKGNIGITAPTNKAVKVLRAMAEYKHSSLRYVTCHSMLGLREKIDTKTGKQTFLQDKDVDPLIGNFQLVVVDEVSQLDDYLFGLILPYTRFDLKVIFIGDPCQIPPINKLDCIPLDAEQRKKYSIGRSVLLEPVRQAKGNPIIELSTDIRKDIHRDTLVYELQPRLVQGKGYLTIDANAGREIMEVLGRFFDSDNFKTDTDFCKVVAWHNKVVDRMNKRVRETLFTNSKDKIVIGDKLIANTPIFRDKTMLFTTNDDFEVMAYTVEDEVINDGQFAIKHYVTKVKYMAWDGTEKEETIKIVHEESEELFKKLLSTLADNANSTQPGYKQYLAWQEFWEFQKAFADVKYNYALTAHKAQGSTYDNVIVYKTDIFTNPTAYERNRIFYTAVTRPRRIAFLIE